VKFSDGSQVGENETWNPQTEPARPRL